jgi:glutamate-1-semialdehyde 2,1-aminomutase
MEGHEGVIDVSKVSNPKHDSAGRRRTPDRYTPINESRVKKLTAEEWKKFRSQTPASGEHNKRASKVLPLGVTSSFQHWDPYPLSIVSAKGAYFKDVDGRKLLDLSMGFGAMLVGHLNKDVMRAVKKAMRSTGTLFVTPGPIATEAAERFQKRFDLDMIRFTNSGTESTMYAIRAARAATGKSAIIKIEGGYHGGYDPLLVSVKAPLNKIGSAKTPKPFYPPEAEGGEVFVVGYNDADRLEAILKKDSKNIACFMIEPIIENLSIILPDEGYLKRVRELCDKYKVALIFDEVKSGLTAGVAGAAARVGVKPDLITLAKSIGGGLPLAAFGGKKEFMQPVVDGTMPHFGTYNGNPLVMAAAIAVDEIATPEKLAAAEKINNDTLDLMDAIIDEYALPAHTVGFGVKGAVIWSPTAVRNYRDFKATDFDTAELSWLWGINRGIVTPPGLDEQWLVSFAHTQKDMNKLVESFRELAQALRS